MKYIDPIVMALLLVVAGATFGWTMRRRLPPLLFGRTDVRWDRAGERINALLRFGLGQRRLVAPGEGGSGLAHILVFSAFMVLSLRTVTLIAMGFAPSGPDFALPLLDPKQGLGSIYTYAQQTVLVGMLLGVAIFFYYRVIKPKERLTLSVEGWAILLTIASLSITDLLFEGAHMAQSSQLGRWPASQFVTSLVARGFRSLDLSDATLHVLSRAGYWIHVVTILAFGNFLPYGKHFHIITGLPTVFLQRLPPVGTLSKLDLENSTQFGAAKVTDLSWKEMLDTYSCTECGRCQTHCPTYVTGKPLSHKEVNRAIRHHLEELAPQMPMPLLQLLKKRQAAAASGEGATATGPQLPELKPLVGEGGILPDETIWACTTCGWCETSCPVFIEQVPRIIDMRRNKVLMEASFPAEAQRVFDGMEQQSNPWGVGSNKRAEWAEGLDVPVAANLAAAGNKFEYLFFVGCAGSYDDRQKKVTKAIVKILREGKIDFAILGEEEQCTGDSARRLGNEYLFQTMAQANIETFQRYGVTKVITQCPHCFNTIANEYQQFGVKFEAIHHTQLIDELVKSGRIQLTKEVQESVTFHDSCYLARYNDVIEEPRNILKSVPKLKVLEMPRSGKQGFCCGAGGGRMWLEEKIGSRVNQNRVNEAAETGAQTVATSCPFCLTMIRDGINETGREEKLVAKDIAEIVVASMKETAPTEPQA